MTASQDVTQHGGGLDRTTNYHVSVVGNVATIEFYDDMHILIGVSQGGSFKKPLPGHYCGVGHCNWVQVPREHFLFDVAAELHI